GDPALVLALMNDYLEETSLVLQKKYQGWLESYVGDMVCYYWPVWDSDTGRTYTDALKGAVELARLQQRFFATLPQRYRGRLPRPVLARLAAVIDAGIGLATGTAVMGDLGPRRGIRRFGILGDPLNLAARLESLTRHFDCRILIHGELLVHAAGLGLKTRRLGRFRVKGRTTPVTVYALGTAAEAAFAARHIERWDSWLAELEQGRRPQAPYPPIYARDCATLESWWRRGLLRGGIWYLEEK
ncbi:MAG TPA: adenylate/guanylate cyclase domain-containing protein, partial [Sedimenticola sp.]|nr:adenylate/guanylate cyclase domain-containing protein [Sedimenticola sp.]